MTDQEYKNYIGDLKDLIENTIKTLKDRDSSIYSWLTEQYKEIIDDNTKE